MFIDNSLVNFETSMYYTFSTIAQVLAGFIALSGVFVVIKLGELKKIILLIANDFYDIGLIIFPSTNVPENLTDLELVIKTESIRRIIYEMIAFTNLPNVSKHSRIDSLLKKTHNIMLVDFHKNKIKKLTIISIYIGIVTILFSLVALTTTSIIHNQYQQYEIYILFFGIVLTSITFGFMLNAIILSLQDLTYNMNAYYSEFAKEYINKDSESHLWNQKYHINTPD